ncbi:hypothetical protein BD410DRAFT_839785 [Rickenella mellea]|uniref:Uncharacterized protein n=1 Tax=Rickenella mellea TaxID=50990 RepID=A0A4Y7Q542_9AGAM|nr:hypothetical protein BD410DRAFT_839785 [Rickenella mellea]
MNSIPNDILSKIFQDCFQNQRTEKFGCACPSLNEAPLLLLRVCQRWHVCALSTPSLWSQLSVGRGKNGLLSVIAAKVWLDRAGLLPLSLDLRYDKGDPTQERAIDAAMVNIFTPSRIWKAVFLEVYRPVPDPRVDAILDAVLTHAPVLESFALLVTGYADRGILSGIMPTRTIKFGLNPCLASISVYIKHLEHRFRLSFTNIHTYGNIRDLTLHYPESISHCLQILDRCPNVEVLRISLHGEVRPSRTTFLMLKQLHRLEVTATVTEGTDFGDFFRALCTPALIQLSIQKYESWGHPRPRNWPSLAQLLERCQPPLKSFTLVGPCMNDNDIISCLQHTQQLTVLSGDELLLSSKVMDALTPNVDRQNVLLCPLLAKIGIHGRRPIFLPVAAMIYERWKRSKQKCISDAVNLQIPMVEAVEMPSEYCSRFLSCLGMTECVENGMELQLTSSASIYL